METTFMQAVGIQIGVYLAVVIFVFLALNFLSAGFLFKWFRVKSSRGALILMKIRTLNQDYFSVGKLEDGFLVWKDKKKSQKRLAITNKDQGAIYKSMGVSVIDIDDEKNAFQVHDWSKVSGFDAEKFEDLYKRALYKPALLDKNTQMILIGVIVIGLLVAGGFYLTYQWHQEVLQAIQTLHNIGQPVSEAVIQGGG